MTKSELRKLYLEKRIALSPEESAAKSLQIAARFFENFNLSSIKYIHCFISAEKFNEVDTKPIFQRLWSDFPQIQTVVPRVDRRTGKLESLKYGTDVELVHNRWQIGEPAHNECVEAAEIDMVLVPLVCFDRHGHRVGYGKGFYDRFLSECREDCLKIGLSFFEPVERIDDSHAGDVRLDFGITPNDVFATGTVRIGKEG